MARKPSEDNLLDDFASDFLEEDEEKEEKDEDWMKDTEKPAKAADDDAASDDWLEETDLPGQLTVDVYQDESSIYVRAPVPGVSKSDIDLSIVDNTLTVRGTRVAETTVKQEDFYQQECYWGEFSRSIILPVQVVEEEAQAVLKDGMLTVKIPKADVEKVKKIAIA